MSITDKINRTTEKSIALRKKMWHWFKTKYLPVMLFFITFGLYKKR